MNSFEKIDSDIDQKLETAKQNALPKEEALKMMNKISELSKVPNTTDPEVEKEITRLEEMIDKSSVIVDTISEFKILIEKTLSNTERVYQLLNHENAHANMTEIVGAVHKGYGLHVYKEKDGRIFFLPYTHMEYPAGWNEKEINQARIEIYSAPEKYGDKLSQSDSERIEELRKDLNE